jgi:peptide/nickel transport system substrate-binding protein
MQSTNTPLSLLDRLLGLIEHPHTSDRVLLRGLLFTTIAASVFFLLTVNSTFTTKTPTRGGILTEGIIGIPRFVNPALAITRADQDTVALLYSGLMKIDATGALVPDLAESVTVSEDGTMYSVTVAKNQFFHDGTPLTARDVLFTIDLMQDPDLKSPLRGNWSDVTIQPMGEYEFTVILSEPYAPFIENFTFGVMPAHIWESIPIEQLPFSQYNTEPVGSGPFMLSEVVRDASGLISGYNLRPNPYKDTEPNLAEVALRFYQNETLLLEALTKHVVNATVFLPPEAIDTLPINEYQIISEPLPRAFGIFINQNRSVALRDTAARQALSRALDRPAIVAAVLGGYGVPTDKPIIEAQRAVLLENATEDEATTTLATAADILTAGNWKKNELGIWEKRIGEETQSLAVTISTGNSALFEATAALVADTWRELGVEVQIEQYEQTDLVQSVIRSRDFQALLFGIDMNRLQDLYPFWHSSQKDDPGLNISQYTNVTVDRLLETLRTATSSKERNTTLDEISNIITTESPAIFLFAPSVTYVIASDLDVAPLVQLGRPSDRFMNIAAWYARTDTVWSIFQN